MAKYVSRASKALCDDVKALDNKYLDAVSTLKAKNDLVAGEGGNKCIRHLVGALDDGMGNLGILIANLEEKMDLDAYADLVPAIALRTVRLWCILNTKENRRQAQTLNRAAFGEFKEKIRKMIKVNSPSSAINPERTRGLFKKKGIIHSVTPCVYFFCLGTGYTKDGQPYSVHPCCYAGDTDERLDSWPEFNAIRTAARNAHIGALDIAAWKEFYQNLQKLDDEANQEGLEIAVVQEAISKFALEGTPVPDAISNLPAFKELQKPLRAVSNHVEFAFKDEKGEIISVPCCYGCKISIGYAEAITPEELENDLGDERKPLDFSKRKNPHSCAEVVASRYCVMERLNGEETRVASTVTLGEPSL
ncbi:hypothetical protein FCIRC_13312 [Fusarium circinatum]|uniref:Uncharacterized protein n=1 Tax=Fusarium circinatum TaxID=48490 RepID=A0A8H5SUI4_FUSCI|nr:hypothetical protein FCIRC_13312 [Fusarium circinatum]